MYVGFLQEPQSITIAYGIRAIFVCIIDDYRSFAFRWVANNSEIVHGADNQGFRVSSTRLSSNVRNVTLEVDGSYFVYNNLQIKCKYADVTSAVAILRIRGITKFVIVGSA